jgi:hypothetical protein
MFVILRAVVILAVDDARLLRMQLQTAFLQTPPYRLPYLTRLRLALAVNDGIIGIPLKLQLRVMPP